MKEFFERTSLLLVAAFLGAATTQAQKSPQDMDRFVDALIKRMAVEEKIGQLNLPVTGEITTGQAKNSDVAKKIERGLAGGLFSLKGIAKIRDVQKLAVENSQLGILLLSGMDVIHGYETVFPIPLGLSCTWDTTTIQESARIAAVEANVSGISWTFSPIMGVSRDPRWGRASEGSGEDPFLGGAIAKAMVYGYQRANFDDQLKRDDEILARVKHFALYGAGEAGRGYDTVDMSHNRMFSEYMYPYGAAVEASVGNVMASLNEIGDVPATTDKQLITSMLRKQWGFNSFVVTDFIDISEMIEHGIGDLQTISAHAPDTDIGMDMVSEGFASTLKKFVMSDKANVKTLGAAYRRILEAKYKLGLFDNPYKYYDLDQSTRDIFTKEHRATARCIAAESFVLLRDGSVKRYPDPLPGPLLLLRKEEVVAVIGPLGNTRSNMPGTWSVAARPNDYPPLYEGLKGMMNGEVNITYAKDSNLISDATYEERATMFGRSLSRDSRTDKELLGEALRVAADADAIMAVLDESFEMSGGSSSHAGLDLPGVQRSLLEALLNTDKPAVLTFFTGRPLTLTWGRVHVPAVLNVWSGGSEAAYAIGDILFGDVSPGGGLTMTFPKGVGQIPLFYNHKNTGRPPQADRWSEEFHSNYLNVDNDALYPFGYGLSYTIFQYSDVALGTPSMEQNGSITAVITATNTGERDGSEVVQLYIRDLVGNITRPVRGLKSFEKIFPRAGENKTVPFKIIPGLLRFYDCDLSHVAEPGEFDLFIGGSSRAAKTARITLK